MQGIVTRKQYDTQRRSALFRDRTINVIWCKITLHTGQTHERTGHEAVLLNMIEIGQEFLLHNGQFWFGPIRK